MDTLKPPSNLIILGTAVLSVLTLFALVPGFHAYYDQSFDAAVEGQLEEHSDLGGLEAARGEWAAGLCLDGAGRANCPGTPIDEVIAGFQGRNRMEAHPSVTPVQPAEMNYTPLVGWNGRPNEDARPQEVQPHEPDIDPALLVPAIDPDAAPGEEGAEGGDAEGGAEGADGASAEVAPAPAAPVVRPRPRPRPRPAPEPAAPTAPAPAGDDPGSEKG